MGGKGKNEAADVGGRHFEARASLKLGHLMARFEASDSSLWTQKPPITNCYLDIQVVVLSMHRAWRFGGKASCLGQGRGTGIDSLAHFQHQYPNSDGEGRDFGQYTEQALQVVPVLAGRSKEVF